MTTTIVETLLPRSRANLLSKSLLVLVGVVLIAVSAKVQVPFWPVPMTFQTLTVLLIGATCGARLGGSTLLAYLAAGAAGIPVFATGVGLAYMAGPTGGYLAGFLLAAIAVGWLAERGHGSTVLSALAMFAIGEAIIFSLGIGWLATLIGSSKAIAGGLLPFIPAEILKMALASAALALAWKRTKA
jgi:biotin transport system substrate-specific component